jgi:hypothetical protein
MMVRERMVDIQMSQYMAGVFDQLVVTVLLKVLIVVLVVV